MIGTSVGDLINFLKLFFIAIFLFAGAFHAGYYLQILRGDIVINRVDLANQSALERFLDEYLKQWQVSLLVAIGNIDI